MKKQNENIDLNSDEFNKHRNKKQKIKTTDKNIDMSSFSIDKAKGLLKNHIIQIAIGLVIYLVLFGLSSTFFFLFYSPIYLFSFILIFCVLYAILKKKILTNIKL